MYMITRDSTVAVFFAATAILIVGAARGDETEVSGRNVLHVTKFEPVEIGEGRMLIAVGAVGVTIHPDGEITTAEMWGQLERVEGVGPDRGYFERTWPDGSTTLERFDGEAKLDANGVPVFGGSFEYVAGTGRFEGITGHGTFEGGRGYDNGMLVVDWRATMNLPAQ
jgi:hypothetical protein